MLRVLIVDDSPVSRDMLREILGQEDDMEVVGEARDGAEAVTLVARLKPDVITMDVQMPKMDGFAATRKIMHSRPTPIVIVSGSVGSPDVQRSMELLRAGALTVIGKPGAPNSTSFDLAAKTLVEAVRTMAEVKVVRQRSPVKDDGATATAIKSATAKKTAAATTSAAAKNPANGTNRHSRIVAIAASTGGPQAVHQLLSLLPAGFPLPILLVQHISHGFLEGFTEWLDDRLSLRVVVASQNQVIEPSTVYVAPDHRHLGVGSRDRISLTDAAPINGFRPAATALFESVASRYGGDSIACILTGMGDDGVHGLRAVKNAGGLVYAQDQASCVVYGMPAAAVEAGLVDVVDSPEGIAASLCRIVRSEKK